ncbi:MAG: hypothetical protein GX288_01945 [Clostridiales bacterium]|nr:hypothetical protein [Clostridiales bacterium]
MRINRMSDATKVLILVATVIVVCVLCAVGFKMVNEGKSSVNASTNNFNSMIGQYSEVDLAIYDGADVQGSEVVNLIKKTTSDNALAIGVLTTKRANTDNKMVYYNKTYTVDTQGEGILSDSSAEYSTIEEATHPESKDDYINPSAQFTGKVHKNKNGLIICIEFVQVN